MTSIRRKTILGMVLLLCIALGAISLLIYRSSRSALDDKNDAIRNLLEKQFEGDRDAAMFAQVSSFATLADVDLKYVSIENSFQVIATEVHAYEEKLTRLEEDIPNEFLQFTANPRTWRSQTLKDEGATLPLPAVAPAPFEHNFTDAPLKSRQLRVISLKVPLDHYAIDRRRLPNDSLHKEAIAQIGGSATYAAVYPPQMMRGRPGNQSPDPRRTPRIETPSAVVQIGWDTVEHPTIKKLRAKYQQQVADLDLDVLESLARLRLTFYSISLATLLAAVIGGGMVISHALKPLRTLSQAVSEVSEKNFTLPIDALQMPVEVRPTVEKLKSTLDMLRCAFEREKQATADISHELRTPIASLNATLDVALKKLRTASEYRDVLVDCRMIGKEMGGLVERIMSLAYLDAGQVHMKNEAVNANDLLSVCGAISKPLAEAQGLNFHMNLEPNIQLRTDPDKLREVVMNLLHNAIEYNQPGGDVELNAKTWGTGLEVDVRDTGIGIGSDIKDKIFERFYRGDPSRANTGVHAGLGLAIVKEYISRLGGTLELESQVGQGSRFKVRLPNR